MVRGCPPFGGLVYVDFLLTKTFCGAKNSDMEGLKDPLVETDFLLLLEDASFEDS